MTVLYALFALFLLSSLSFLSDAIYVSPYPCYEGGNCPPYYRSPAEQFYEVWISQDDDWSLGPSYVYVDEKPEEMENNTYMNSESYTFALIDTSKPMKLKVLICSSEETGNPGNGQLCGNTYIDASSSNIQCFMDDCEWDIADEGDGSYITFNVYNLDAIEGSQTLSIELWGSPQSNSLDERRVLQNSLFIFYMNEDDYVECPKEYNDYESGSFTFTGPNLETGDTGYWDLTYYNDEGIFYLENSGWACLEFGAYVRGFIRSKRVDANDDGILFCGDSTDATISGFGGIWRSGYGNYGGKKYEGTAYEISADVADWVWGLDGTISACGDNIAVKEIAVVGAIGANSNINVNGYWMAPCLVTDSDTYCYSGATVSDTKVLGTFGYSTDGINTGVGSSAYNNFIMCGDDAIKPMEDRQYFSGNVIWQLENGFPIMFGWNYPSTDYKVVMNTDIWHVDQFWEGTSRYGAPDGIEVPYRAVVGAVYGSPCDFESIEFGRVNNLRVLGDVWRLFSFQASDNDFGGCCPIIRPGDTTCDPDNINDIRCGANDYETCSAGFLKDFGFGFSSDGDNSGWGINLYGIQSNPSILRGPFDYSIMQFAFDQTRVDEVLITQDNKYVYFDFDIQDIDQIWFPPGGLGSSSNSSSSN